MKIIPALTTMILSVACIVTGCQSPKAISSSGNNSVQSATNSIRTLTARASANSAPTDRILVIDPSSMPIAEGKATLIIGALQRANGVYQGDYQIEVFPYFLKNEKGTLAIVVSDESLAMLNRGKVAAIIGTATTSGIRGRSRHIDATATPIDINHGTLKLWFVAGNRKMVFEPAYRFAEKRTAGLAGQTTLNNSIDNSP
jgi:hypothetical protein